MKNLTLAAVVLIVVLANAFALAHAARNRAGIPDAEVILTQRELRYFGHPAADEDSGVTLQMNWYGAGNNLSGWLGTEKLRHLGFDCRVAPDSPQAAEFYQRQRARKAFVALENDGRAWQKFLESRPSAFQVREAPTMSRLVAIDADADAVPLRARHPDRSQVLIVPAMIGIIFSGGKYGSGIQGIVRQIPSSIYVPRPFSDPFRAHPANSSYRVHLRYGREFEPWVTAVEFATEP